MYDVDMTCSAKHFLICSGRRRTEPAARPSMEETRPAPWHGRRCHPPTYRRVVTLPTLLLERRRAREEEPPAHSSTPSWRGSRAYSSPVPSSAALQRSLLPRSERRRPDASGGRSCQARNPRRRIISCRSYQGGGPRDPREEADRAPPQGGRAARAAQRVLALRDPNRPNNAENEERRRATIESDGCHWVLIGLRPELDKGAAGGADRHVVHRSLRFGQLSGTTASRVELSRCGAFDGVGGRGAGNGDGRFPTPAAESRLWRSCASPNVHARRRASSTKGCNPPPPLAPGRLRGAAMAGSAHVRGDDPPGA
jgi:hypothetical protein